MRARGHRTSFIGSVWHRVAISNLPLLVVDIVVCCLIVVVDVFMCCVVFCVVSDMPLPLLLGCPITLERHTKDSH